MPLQACCEGDYGYDDCGYLNHYSKNNDIDGSRQNYWPNMCQLEAEFAPAEFRSPYLKVSCRLKCPRGRWAGKCCTHPLTNDNHPIPKPNQGRPRTEFTTQHTFIITVGLKISRSEIPHLSELLWAKQVKPLDCRVQNPLRVGVE